MTGPIIYLSPRGKPLTQAMAQAWSEGPGLIVFCGRFEGLDERVIEARGMEEVCVGDAVLAGGEAAAFAVAWKRAYGSCPACSAMKARFWKKASRRPA